MLDGIVRHIGADATDKNANNNNSNGPAGAGDPEKGGSNNPLFYRALIALQAGELMNHGDRHKLVGGMQASAEINLGSRTALQYLLSPIQKTVHAAWRER